MDALPPTPHVLWVHGQGLTTTEHNQYNGIPSIHVTEHPSCGTRFGRIYKTTMSSSWWCVLLPETTPHRCVESHIPHALWVHGQDLTSLGHNQCAGMPYSQSRDHNRPSCGTRFGKRTCITTMPSPAWCILLHGKPYAMDVLPPISHVLWVHGQDMTTMGHNQYTTHSCQ